ncbi:MAG: hypothetical protein LBU51_01560 [Bacteroidales bacterium]|jgi:hypothetical protein|nr:hypothetical protein [Bacteroidales bacterium]
MKRIKILLLFFAATLFFAACEKDELGRKITYYKNVTGEGYAFYRYKDGTLVPFANEKVEIGAGLELDNGGWSGVRAEDEITQTDSKGFYSCRFVKSVAGYKMNRYGISPILRESPTLWKLISTNINVEIVEHISKNATSLNPQIIKLDTIYVEERNN